MMRKNPAAAALGRIKSPAKTRAVRENGKLGGRPPLPRCAKCGAKVHNAEEHVCEPSPQSH
jgi:hypothetical protein